jgi:type VI secretion system protein
MRTCLQNVFLALALASCASKLPPTGLQTIQVLADVNANQNNATALDLVFVYDSSTLPLLPKSGPEWFDKKAALVAGLATAIDVVSLQIPPASNVNLPAAPPFPARYAKAVGVYGYANYVTPAGQAVLNLTPYGTVGIMLAPDTVTMTGQLPKGVFDKLLGAFSSKAPAK